MADVHDVKEATLSAERLETAAKDNVYLEDDPHRAALEDNPDKSAPVQWSTMLAVFFLGTSFSGAIGTGFLLVSAILVPIGLDLGNLEQVGWIPSSWALTSGMAMAVAGRLSDIFGRRNVILSGQAVLIVGGIVGATAQQLSAVIAGSALLGIGTGGIFASYAGIAEALPNKYRGAGLAWTEIGIAVPWGVLSCLLGNELAEHATWRWAYYLTIIYSVISMIGTALTYFPPARPRHDDEKSRWQEFIELDFVGFFLYAAGTTVLLVGLAWAGEPGHPWKSASVIAPVVLGGFLFIGAFGYDWTVRPRLPLLPWHIFRLVREFSLILVVIFVGGMVFLTMASLLTQATATIYDSDPTKLGIALIPNGLGLVVGGVLFPSLIHKIKHVRLQIVFAIALQTIFTGLYAYAVQPGHKAAWVTFQFFGTMGFAWITLVATVLISVNVPLSDLGIASGLLGSFRNIGGCIGLAIFNTIRNNIFSSQIIPRMLHATETANFKADPETLKLLLVAVAQYVQGNPLAFKHIPGANPALVSATAEAYRGAYAYAYQRVFWATIPFGIVATIAACFIAEPSLYLTNHTALRLEGGILGGGRTVNVQDHEDDVEAPKH